MTTKLVKETALYLPPDFIKEMKKGAIDHDVSPSKLVQLAVREYLANHPVEATAPAQA